MGWSTWNQFKQNISEKAVLGIAETMKEKGLLAAGYRYINLDDCWQSSQRDENMRLCFDEGRFPSKDGFIAKLNKLGFKAGLYSSCGNFTCEDMPGSYGYEDLDAKTFVEWGVEYLKYDYCHVVDLPTDPHHEERNFAIQSPPVLYIGVSGIGNDGYELMISSKDAEVIPPAQFNNGIITGLDCPRAYAKFTVDVPKSGRYQIAVGYAKEAFPFRQFLLLSVNGNPCAQVWFPPTSGWNSTGRVMAVVELDAGQNILALANPIRGQREDSQMRYIRMGEALKKAALPGQPIYYSICEHGRTAPWEWAGDIASSWRVSPDIRATWDAILDNYEIAADLSHYQRPGAYNDPDMLEVGIGDLTYEENRSHFILWCMLSAPLILGLDVCNADDKILSLITDTDFIGINQDSLLLQAFRVKLNDGLDLLIKPLADDRVAMCLFNKSDTVLDNVHLEVSQILRYDNRIQLNLDDKYNIHKIHISDTWGFSDGFLSISSINPHAVALAILEK